MSSASVWAGIRGRRRRRRPGREPVPAPGKASATAQDEEGNDAGKSLRKKLNAHSCLVVVLPPAFIRQSRCRRGMQSKPETFMRLIKLPVASFVCALAHLAQPGGAQTRNDASGTGQDLQRISRIGMELRHGTKSGPRLLPRRPALERSLGRSQPRRRFENVRNIRREALTRLSKIDRASLSRRTSSTTTCSRRTSRTISRGQIPRLPDADQSARRTPDSG